MYLAPMLGAMGVRGNGRKRHWLYPFSSSVPWALKLDEEIWERDES